MYTCNHIHLDDWKMHCRDSETNRKRDKRSGQAGKVMMLCCSPTSAKAKRWKGKVHTNLLNAPPGYRGTERSLSSLIRLNAQLPEHST